MNEAKAVRPGIRNSGVIGRLFAIFLTVSAASAFADPLPPPVPRIARTFDIETSSTDGLVTTAAAAILATRVNHFGDRIWDVVRFWDLAGDRPPVERGIDDTDKAGTLFAHGDLAYLTTSKGVHIVSRDIAVPVRYFPMPAEWELIAVNAGHLILRGPATLKGQPLRFIRTTDLQWAGDLDTAIRVKGIVARENDMLLYGTHPKKTDIDLIGSMRYPVLSRDKPARGKLAKVRVNYWGVLHFGAKFAVVQVSGRAFYKLITWQENGSATVVDLDAGDLSLAGTAWAEADGDLYGPGSPLSRVRVRDSVASLETVGLPASMSRPHLMGGGGSTLFLTQSFYQRPWFYQLHAGHDRQLAIHSTTARERDSVMRFEVRLDAPADGEVRFSYESRAGSARDDIDFTPVSGTATLSPGETLALIEVPLIEDHLIEQPESFELHLTGCSGARCDDSIAIGRITGSGARVIAREPIPWSIAQSFATSTTGTVRELVFPGGRAVAARLGFEYFATFEENPGPHVYAKGVPSDPAETRICQFDAETGELLEAFPDSVRWKLEDHQITLAGEAWNGPYLTYGFHDGFPVISFEDIPIRENGGRQVLVSASERSRLDLEFEAAWTSEDPDPGAVSLHQLTASEIVLTIDPNNDNLVQIDRILDLAVTAVNLESGNTSSSRTAVDFADDDHVLTTLVPNRIGRVDRMATDGTRLWTGTIQGSQLEDFSFSGGRLHSRSVLGLPNGRELAWYDHGCGQAIAFSSNSMAAVTTKGRTSSISSWTVDRPRPKGRHSRATQRPSALLHVGRYLVSGEGREYPGDPAIPGRVRILDAASGKARHVLESPSASPGFGYGLATGGGMLWVASPPLRKGRGLVYGYSLDDFSLIRTLESPQDVVRGVFGVSIAADDRYLVIGESSQNTGGAVWVFTADGQKLLKKLDAGTQARLQGFGAQVATRSGRIMVGGGSFSRWFEPGEMQAEARGIPEVQSATMIWKDRALLWMELEDSPLWLIPPEVERDSGRYWSRIALLEDGAVLTTDSLHVYPFPKIPTPPTVAGSQVGTTLPGGAVWPDPDAPEPRWGFHRSGDGTLGVRVDPSTVSAQGGNLQLEWSDDLRIWKPVAEPGVLEVSLHPATEPTGFLRLRSLVE